MLSLVSQVSRGNDVWNFISIGPQNQINTEVLLSGSKHLSHQNSRRTIKQTGVQLKDMKTVIVVLLVGLVVSHSEALRCYCGGNSICSSSTQTCSGSNQVCISFVFSQPGIGYFKNCYKAFDCAKLINSALGFGRCCQTDLCNK
ncbi:hypothetical protein JOB18_031482 [Solea senegalensis]|uniref:Uncharacterized protein n=1 Tax=Solea senegalensis TaxID=28829 RepID=A0AAV6RPU3_SOLSE|nr:hypothetical protein JOB18_031482 [Solea senegalensis]